MISEKFKTAYLLHERPRFRLALAAGSDPSWLSGIIHGSRKVEFGDQRVVRIGQMLGLRPGECFESVDIGGARHGG